VKRARIAIALAAIAIAFGALWVFRETLVLFYFGAKLEKRTLEEQVALIKPSVHVFAPIGGAGPYPTVIMFHGCAGYKPQFIEAWAKIANDAGFLAIAVDSGEPRGLDREAMLATVCTGKKLIGQERAADVAAAYAIALARDDVDPGRIALAGWSHGAWTLMDYLSFAGARRAPPSIRGSVSLEDPAGVILFYPYCGEGSWSRLLRWRTKAKILALVAGGDTIVDGLECKLRIEKIERQGTPIDLEYYPEADHAFDDITLIGGEYEYFYSHDATENARERVATFLNSIKSRD